MIRLSSGAPSTSTVRQGYLEASNTSVVGEMANMMTAMRSFEANQKIIQMQDERLGKAISDLAEIHLTYVTSTLLRGDRDGNQQLNLDVISNNLSNVNTTGFKRSKIEFQDLLYQNTSVPGARQGNGTQLLTPAYGVGQGSRAIATSKIFTEGELTQTGEASTSRFRAMVSFKLPNTRRHTGYTRDGSLKTSSKARSPPARACRCKTVFNRFPWARRRDYLTQRPVTTNGVTARQSLSGAVDPIRQPGWIAKHRTQFIYRNNRLRHARNRHSGTKTATTFNKATWYIQRQRGGRNGQHDCRPTRV